MGCESGEAGGSKGFEVSAWLDICQKSECRPHCCKPDKTRSANQINGAPCCGIRTHKVVVANAQLVNVRVCIGPQ